MHKSMKDKIYISFDGIAPVAKLETTKRKTL